ncbi:MAG: thioredoxin-disulfide reductase [Candidatus Curtissbacteria bacterium]|nr:thioredoxin-disulfide reductase [Candidatus Curtissbacteria bacterium]
MSEEIRNVIIIGSGPAGFSAGLYTARANLKPLLFSGSKWGGQLMLTTDVENYPGFPEGIQGPELMKKFRDQAVRFGCEIIDEEVSAVDFKKKPFEVFVGSPLPQGSGEVYKTKSVIIATGAETNWLGLSNEQRLIGRGISSCAPCDAFFFKDKKVIVVGGGDSAMEEALTLTKFASEVTIIHRRGEFRASKIMLDRAQKNPKIKFMVNTIIMDVMGNDKVEGVRIKDKRSFSANKSDESEREIAVDGLFVAIGHHPVTDIFKGQVELDEKGYVIRKPQGSEPTSLQMTTSVEGVFVAGDVHDLHFKQAVTAAGYGCAAALEAERWLEAQD